MHIAVATNGAGPHAQVEPVFGRADFFVIVDTTSGTHTTLPNPYKNETTKIGRQVATMLMQHNINVVLCGDIGPKSKLLLAEADIYTGIGYDGTVLEAIERYKSSAI